LQIATPGRLLLRFQAWIVHQSFVSSLFSAPALSRRQAVELKPSVLRGVAERGFWNAFMRRFWPNGGGASRADEYELEIVRALQLAFALSRR
jgi:hypothetical protein